MSRAVLRGVVIAVIFLFVGVAGAAAVFYSIPDAGSAPSVYDDFRWSSTANGFWHVNPIGATERIKGTTLTLTGDSIELDRRIQTDPRQTVVMARVKAAHFHKFGLGIGVYHAGTMGMELDDDGIKCGRGTDRGWRVDTLQGWKTPPVGRWFYLKMAVVNPYPDQKVADRIPQTKLKPVTLTCSAYDNSGHLLGQVTPHHPSPNAHYVALDEVFRRTWDSKNDYTVDWFYAGPPAGVPAVAPGK